MKKSETAAERVWSLLMRWLNPFLFLALMLAAVPGNGAPVLQVTAEADSVSVRGASAAGEVLFIGYHKTVRRYEPVYQRFERVITADATGQATFSLAQPLQHDAYWVAVDLSTGAFGTASPPGRRLRGGELPAAALLRRQSGRVRAVEAQADHAYIVVVRPNSNTWRGTAGDGAASDGDGRANGHIEIAVSGLKPLRGNTRGPDDDLGDGDLVFVFFTHRMTFLARMVRP